jgi:hypothetical protein
MDYPNKPILKRKSMAQKKNNTEQVKSKKMPNAEDVARELGKATSIDDFYGKDGIFARLFSETVEQMLEAELTKELGYERYEAAGRNSGNNRNGHCDSSMRTSGGDAKIKVPRDRNGEFQSELLKKNSNEIEQKIITMYAKGTSTAWCLTIFAWRLASKSFPSSRFRPKVSGNKSPRHKQATSSVNGSSNSSYSMTICTFTFISHTPSQPPPLVVAGRILH